MPESILSWKGVMHHEEIVDDPSQHNGRIRSFKHERGNWSTLVYIDCKLKICCIVLVKSMVYLY